MDIVEEDDGFEGHYDIIIVGTGLIQSIVSRSVLSLCYMIINNGISALSKGGKRVLHIDQVNTF